MLYPGSEPLSLSSLELLSVLLTRLSLAGLACVCGLLKALILPFGERPSLQPYLSSPIVHHP
jgi:hypothetical protein